MTRAGRAAPGARAPPLQRPGVFQEKRRHTPTRDTRDTLTLTSCRQNTVSSSVGRANKKTAAGAPSSPARAPGWIRGAPEERGVRYPGGVPVDPHEMPPPPGRSRPCPPVALGTRQRRRRQGGDGGVRAMISYLCRCRETSWSAGRGTGVRRAPRPRSTAGAARPEFDCPKRPPDCPGRVPSPPLRRCSPKRPPRARVRARARARVRARRGVQELLTIRRRTTAS